MRIYNAPTGDPMLIDAASGLSSLAQQVEAFAASASPLANFAAEICDTAEPYDEMLLGLRLKKGSGQQLTISDDRWLELSASQAEIRAFAALLREPAAGDHRHLYCKPVSLIVEEGTPWLEA